ncbi:MAG: energy-coupling factor transporter transmembrane component T [Candidatus Bathyarchaeia archaeon]
MSSIGTALLRKSIVVKETLIHKADPRTKFIFFLWISLWAYIFLDYVLTAIFLAVIILLAITGRILKRILLTVAVIVVPWMALGIPILSALFPWNETLIYRLSLFQWEIPLYYEGFAWGLTYPLRIGVCITSALLFYLTTNPPGLIALLFKLKFPFRFIYVTAAAVQLTPLLVDEAGTIYQAQLSRGFRTDVNIIKRIFNFLVLVVPLTLSSINKVQIRAIALESRGFSAPVAKTNPYDIRFKSVDYAFFIGMIIGTVILTYIYFVYGFSPITHLRFYLVVG